MNQDQQSWVDDAMFDFNSEVFKINKRRNSFSPPLHRTIHRMAGVVRKSHYHHLSDGLHPSDELKLKWSAWLVKATENN